MSSFFSTDLGYRLIDVEVSLVVPGPSINIINTCIVFFVQIIDTLVHPLPELLPPILLPFLHGV